MRRAALRTADSIVGALLQQRGELGWISGLELTAEVEADVRGGLALDWCIAFGEGGQPANDGALFSGWYQQYRCVWHIHLSDRRDQRLGILGAGFSRDDDLE